MNTSIFNSWENKKVMIIGDLMIDRYIKGEVNRMSPEAPVPILNLNQTDDRLGGASNVALNVQALGAQVFLIGATGNDENAQIFQNLLKKHQLSSIGIIKDPFRPTTIKTRVISNGQQLLRIDQESTEDIKPDIENKILDVFHKILSNHVPDVIIFQDYNKGVLTKKLIKNLISTTNLRNIPTIIDPKDHNFYEYKGCTLFKPNLKEIRAKVPFTIQSNQLIDLNKANDFVKKKLQNQITIITLSEWGIYLNNQIEHHICPVTKKEIVDVCGAGDTVLSILALCLASNINLETMGILANIAGGQVCSNIGVVPVNKKELIEEYINYLIKIGS